MPADRIWGDPADDRWRAAAALLVAAAVVATLLPSPTAARTALFLAAVAGVSARLAAGRGRGPADAVLVAAGGVLVTLVLVGLLLAVAGVPLERPGWTVALGVLGLVAALAPLPAPLPPAGRAAVDAAGSGVQVLLRQLPWALAAVAVTVIALVSSVRSAGSVDVAPVALSAVQVGQGHARVVVQSERATGPLELRTDSGTGSTLSYPVFRLPAGGSRVTDVLLPTTGRTTITISNAGQAQPLRSLIVGS